jgi:hypothetical protein
VPLKYSLSFPSNVERTILKPYIVLGIPLLFIITPAAQALAATIPFNYLPFGKV